MINIINTTGRVMHVMSVAERYAEANGLNVRSINCDFASGRVTIYGPRYEVLHVMEIAR